VTAIWDLVRRLAPGFRLVEALFVVLMVGVFAASAALDYTSRRVKTAEAKVVAGALWTAVRADASSACGTAAAVSRAYRRAGLSSNGATTPARWAVSAGDGNSIIVDCGTGAISPDGDVFTISGTDSDVAPLRVKLSYAAAGTPPAQLKCSVDFGARFVGC
jgi:type II secretory pathway pseudopilin PulG